MCTCRHKSCSSSLCVHSLQLRASSWKSVIPLDSKAACSFTDTQFRAWSGINMSAFGFTGSLIVNRYGCHSAVYCVPVPLKLRVDWACRPGVIKKDAPTGVAEGGVNHNEGLCTAFRALADLLRAKGNATTYAVTLFWTRG